MKNQPLTPDTLLLRLLDHGERLAHAIAELAEMPPASHLRPQLMQVALAWQARMVETSSATPMMSPQTKALYDEWENKVLEQGIERGIEQGQRALVRKLLMLRFGTLPASAEHRIDHASPAELGLWAERVLTADGLAVVFGD